MRDLIFVLKLINFVNNFILFFIYFLSVLVSHDSLIFWRTGKVKGETCTEYFRTCGNTPICDSFCKGQWSDGQGFCDSGGLCICKFPCGGKPGKHQINRKCSGSPGFCNDGESACNDECNNKYNGGIGYCDASIDPRISVCTCQYVC